MVSKRWGRLEHICTIAGICCWFRVNCALAHTSVESILVHARPSLECHFLFATANYVFWMLHFSALCRVSVRRISMRCYYLGTHWLQITKSSNGWPSQFGWRHTDRRCCPICRTLPELQQIWPKLHIFVSSWQWVDPNWHAQLNVPVFICIHKSNGAIVSIENSMRTILCRDKANRWKTKRWTFIDWMDNRGWSR